jgi:hypothetical protein
MTASQSIFSLDRAAAWLLVPALVALAACSPSKPAEEPVRAV